MKRFVGSVMVFMMGPAVICHTADDRSNQKATSESIQAAMHGFIERSTVDGQFRIYDAVTGELKRLTFT